MQCLERKMVTTMIGVGQAANAFPGEERVRCAHAKLYCLIISAIATSVLTSDCIINDNNYTN